MTGSPAHTASVTTSRPIRARIDPRAIRHNYLLAKALAPRSRAWAVIKANAYGHGLWRAVHALREVADGFAVLECETALALREAGIEQPILLLEGVFAGRDVRAVQAFDLTTVIHCREQLDLVLAHAEPEKPLAIYLKLNSGMNRLGFRADELSSIRQQLAAVSRSEVTLMTHFAEADGERGVDWQLEAFRRMTTDWPGAVSLANSAAILRFPHTNGDWVRPGIMLYGASPFAKESAADLGLRPAMTLESRIIAVQTLQAGDRVGYSGSFTAERSMRIGIVACGYADGYSRHAPSGTPIAVCGQRTVTVGRVSMDMLACDLTAVPEAEIGSPVTLWGEGSGGVVAADEVATAAGTIAYELFCALAPRVPVEVVGAGR